MTAPHIIDPGGMLGQALSQASQMGVFNCLCIRLLFERIDA